MPLFMDLLSIASNDNAISEKTEGEKWTSIPYETKLGKGRGVITPECAEPENIILNVNCEAQHYTFQFHRCPFFRILSTKGWNCSFYLSAFPV